MVDPPNCPIRCGSFHEEHALSFSLCLSLSQFIYEKVMEIPKLVTTFFSFVMICSSSPVFFFFFFPLICFNFRVRIRLFFGKLMNWKKRKIPRKFQFVISRTECITLQIRIASSSIWMGSPMAELKNPTRIPELQYVFSLRVLLWISNCDEKLVTLLLWFLLFFQKKIESCREIYPEKGLSVAATRWLLAIPLLWIEIHHLQQVPSSSSSIKIEDDEQKKEKKKK